MEIEFTDNDIGLIRRWLDLSPDTELTADKIAAIVSRGNNRQRTEFRQFFGRLCLIRLA